MVFLLSRKLSLRRACFLARISRSSRAYRKRRTENRELVEKLLELSRRHPRFGYRRLWAMLRRQGHPAVNVKRVRRLCIRHGLTLRSRRGRRKRHGAGGAVPCTAEYMNHVWTYDFVHDGCENGRKLKMLTVVDEFTRQCLAIEVGVRLSSRGVIQVLGRLFDKHGCRPMFIRSDNGSEFIAKGLMRWLAERGTQTRHIDPGSPWQNGYGESFNGKFRDECLNMEVFAHEAHARAVTELYRQHYNQVRPHSSLRYRTPAEFAADECVKRQNGQASGCAADGCRFSPPEDTDAITPLSSNGEELSWSEQQIRRW